MGSGLRFLLWNAHKIREKSFKGEEGIAFGFGREGRAGHQTKISAERIGFCATSHLHGVEEKDEEKRCGSQKPTKYQIECCIKGNQIPVELRLCRGEQ